MGNFWTLLKQGPSLGMSKKTEHLLMRIFMGAMIIAVVLLMIWTMPD